MIGSGREFVNEEGAHGAPELEALTRNICVVHTGFIEKGVTNKRFAVNDTEIAMLAYPMTLEKDGNTVLAASTDFPELTTFGENRDEARARALDALQEAIAARIHDRRDIPSPSPGGDAIITLPTLTAVKVILYKGMRDQGLTKTDLARRLGWHLPQVDRVLDVNHPSRLDQMDAALRAIGCHLYVSAVSSPPETCSYPACEPLP